MPVLKAVHPAVHDQFLATLPRVLHHRRPADVERLLDDIEIAQRIDSLGLGQRLEPGRMTVANVLDVADPVVGQADTPVLERRDDAAAA